ncbi:MAG: SPOR domain-containing protein, partial [Treponema sp.]|nr:SPOR domain-containing protein [Treponema sp.]
MREARQTAGNRLAGTYLVFLSFLFFAGPLYGQSGGPQGLSLSAEMRNLERLAGGTDLSPARKKETLSSMARLKELSGDIEGAAKSWSDAAAADQEGQDEPLLRGAACYAAMGEWEKALALARTVLLNSQNRQSLLRARLLEAQIEAFFSEVNSGSLAGAESGASLRALLEEEDFAAYRPSVYYTLWKLSGAGDWKDRLIGEYPRSPEGRIAAAGESGKPAISAAPAPLWLLFPGRGGIPPPGTAAATPAPAVVEPAKAAPAGAAPAASAAAANGEARANAGEPAAGAVLQAGLFSREANALELAERLRQAGFKPQIGRRTVNGREYYAVNLSPGG